MAFTFGTLAATSHARAVSSATLEASSAGLRAVLGPLAGEIGSMPGESSSSVDSPRTPQRRQVAFYRLIKRLASSLAIACGMASALLATQVRAQCNAEWTSVPNPGLNGGVFASVLWDSDGPGPQAPMLVVGGGFTMAGQTGANHIAAWNGAAWQPLGTGTNNLIETLVVYNGDLIAGGSFTSAGGVAASRVARYSVAHGWSALGTGLAGTTDPDALAAIVYHGDLIVAGGFTTAGGVTTGPVARWTDSGVAGAGAWSTTNAGGIVGSSGPFGTQVFALAEYNGELVIGGSFTTAFQPTRGIAKWNGVAGARWQPMNAALTAVSISVFGLTVWNGRLIAAGQFASIGDVSASNVAAWDGTGWQAFGSGVSGSTLQPTVWDVGTFNGEVVVAGAFTSAGGSPASRVASWNGVRWAPLGAGIAGSGSAAESVIVAGGRLFVGGLFTTAGGAPAPNCAWWGCACPPDFNGSGTLNAQDIFDFLAAWFALDSRADFNGVSGITPQDIFDFLAAWFSGC